MRGRTIRSWDPGWRDPRAHQSLGTVLVRRGNPQAALEHFGAAVALEPENARAHSDLGVLLGELGQNDRALEHLGRAVELDQGLVQALLSLGNVQARIGRLEEAEATYRQVVEQDAGNADARLGLGAVLAQTGNFDQAVVELQEALRHEPGDERASRIHFGLAEALVRTGQLKEALPHYTRVREIEPVQGLAWLREATVLMGLGRFEEAIDIQGTLVQEARRLERGGEERRLARNLERYERGEACCARVADAFPPY